jgi:VIT1/CCC1 family predicted Fe2+/Mn2+ transporter
LVPKRSVLFYRWLATVLGANDGIISTASLILGIAAVAVKPADILIAGPAGLAAGAMAMTAGECVSVSSQSDTQKADLNRERGELASIFDGEVRELAGIYVSRGVDPEIADSVARQLMAKDALTAYAHRELGISGLTTARPVQAALTSAATFTTGAALALAIVILSPGPLLGLLGVAASLMFLALRGAIGARADGAPIWAATIRVTFWGATATATAAGIGRLVGRAL